VDLCSALPALAKGWIAVLAVGQLPNWSTSPHTTIHSQLMQEVRNTATATASVVGRSHSVFAIFSIAADIEEISNPNFLTTRTQCVWISTQNFSGNGRTVLQFAVFFLEVRALLISYERHFRVLIKIKDWDLP
jgi:hypothetical protein